MSLWCQVSCVLSNVTSLRYVLANPTVSLHSLSAPQSRSMSTKYFAESGEHTLIRSVRPITSGFEENLKCPISSFNVLSLWKEEGGTHFHSLSPALAREPGFASLLIHSILNRCFAMSWTVTRPGSSLTPHLDPQRPPQPSVTTSQVLWAGKFQSPWLTVQEISSRLRVAAKRCMGTHASLEEHPTGKKSSYEISIFWGTKYLYFLEQLKLISKPGKIKDNVIFSAQEA